MKGATGPPAIEADGLTKVYGSGTRAVDDLSLTVPAGQVFALLGPNGAGKTTTIKMLAGLLTPTKGRARLHGFDVARQRGSAMEQIGAVLEGSRNVYWTLSAWQNLMYFGRIKGLHPADIRPRAEYLLRSLGLWERRKEKVGGYSRGMQQKVAVAAALITDPRIVLLDEPTIGLDVEAARTVKDWIQTLAREQGKTILLTTHQLNVVEEVGDRVAVIRDGQIVVDLPVGELLATSRRRDLYEITVDGSLAEPAVPEGFKPTAADDTTVLRGELPDSASLYGVFDQLRASGATVRSVTQVQPDLEEIFLELLQQERHHG